MNALILLIFIGIFFVAGALGLFVWAVRSGSLQHADRLALLPLHQEHPSDNQVGTNRDYANRVNTENNTRGSNS